MLGFVTDRTQQNVERRAELSRKGWAKMTGAERVEWSGTPLSVLGANLLPNGPHYSSTVDLEYRITEIVATAKTAGSYLYAVVVIGDAADYANKAFTLSAEAITAGAQISLYWHDDAGYEYAGASLSQSGSAMANTVTWPNINNRAYLALYIYVTATGEVAAGSKANFKGVMLSRGDTLRPYVPYTPIVPTSATKGAYNYSDLNRVEMAVAEISALAGLGLTTKTNWGVWDIPKAADMNRYLSNVKRIRDYIGSSEELPETMDNLTYTYANNIEKILEAAYVAASAG